MNTQDTVRRNARMLAAGGSAEVQSAIGAVVGDLGELKPSKRLWMANPIIQVILMIAFYFPVALYFSKTYQRADTSIMRPPFRHLTGNSYSSFHFVSGSVGDSERYPNQSTLDLLENEKKLGPEHSAHHTISSEGGGAYSQWFTGNEGYIIIFSTSDNTDPNTNGRTYRALVR